MMELYKTRKIDFQHKDERGTLTQLIHDGFAQINVLDSKKGVVRGAHYHKRSIEAFYVISGSVEVTLYGKTGENEKVIFKAEDFFVIPTQVLHNMYFLEDCLMVQMYDVPVENSDGSKDIFMEEEFYA